MTSSTGMRALGLAILLACACAAEQSPESGGAAGPLPGASAHPAELQRRLAARLRELGPGYRPRTRHLLADGSPRFTNRLILSTSPYLLQHAHNPVDWHPWGDEAFETARRLGRPVLLSVGYSTCHWCHVMEEESFEDEEIARFMNEHYIAIKVDREERPDVDAIYMNAVLALTGGGGWPMTVWLTPEREPFHGGTYFPARDGDRGVRAGFLTTLRALRRAYDEQPDRVARSAAELARLVRERLTPAAAAGADQPGAGVLRAAAAFYRDRFDAENGGLRGAPKFPGTFPIRLLLRHHRRSGEARSLEMATRTLEKMAAGGMHDQAGGGFHRYATDARWMVPHFEKMLYDNALLALAYLEGWQAGGRREFAGVARDILRYVERDMTAPEGAFYSATDADSAGPDGRREEGLFFTWTPAEIEAALGAERARLIASYYGVTAAGNFEGRSILHVPRLPGETARTLKIEPGTLASIVDDARAALVRARALRPAPLRDEKILAAWNGLMISAQARAALVLGDERHARTAARAADFLLRHLRTDGRLVRSHTDGRPGPAAYLEDYAFLIAGLLDLFEATGEKRWLEEAMALDRTLEALFEDREGGGFFRTASDHERLLVREKPLDDGAEPSGNSVAVLNLLRLHELTTADRYRVRADRALRAAHATMGRDPTALSEMLLAVDFRTDTPKQILIVLPESGGDAGPLLAELRRAFVPNRVLVVVREGRMATELRPLVPLLEGKTAMRNRATAYVCEGRVCDLPTTDAAVFAKQIVKTVPLPAGP